MKNTLPIYIFQKGSIFQEGELVSTESVEFTGTAIIDVETYSNTSKIYTAGTPVTSVVYPNLVESAYVSTQISGGTENETLIDWQERIQDYLTQTPTTEGGLRAFLIRSYPEVIDIKANRTTTPRLRKTGIEIDIYIKLPVEKIIPSTNIIEDIIILCDKEPLSTVNRGLWNEKNTFLTTPNYYYRPYKFKEIQEWVNTNENFSLGLDILLVQPTPYFINAGTNQVLATYINNKSIGTLSLKEYIAETGNILDTFTIQDYYGKNTYTTDSITDNYGGYFLC
jgi:hypothetical protein